MEDLKAGILVGWGSWDWEAGSAIKGIKHSLTSHHMLDTVLSILGETDD